MCSITTYSDRWVMDSYMYIFEKPGSLVMDNNVLKFEFLYSNGSGQGLHQIGAYDYCLLICFPIELMNTIFSSNVQPAMYFKLCSILVQLWLELSQFGAS